MVAAALIVLLISILVIPLTQGQRPVCTKFNQDTSAANAGVGGSPKGYYDEQQWLDFGQNHAYLTYNVTANVFTDTFGFGPGYILNGLSDKGYWYQVGVAYNWIGNGSLPSPSNNGFRLFYEVWDAKANTSVYPSGGGGGIAKLTGNATTGDKFLLSLFFTADGKVLMSVRDWNSGALGSTEYPSFGAQSFIGFQPKFGTHPSSLLMEWNHALPYDCKSIKAEFSTVGKGITSGWLVTDEWYLACVDFKPPCTPFNAHDLGQTFSFPVPKSVDFSNSSSFQSFENPTLGSTTYASPNQFITM